MEDKKATKAISLDQLSKITDTKTKKLFQLEIDNFILPRDYNIRYAGLGFDEYWNQEHVKAYVSDLARDYASGDTFPPIVVKFDQELQKAVIIDGAHRYKAILEANEKLGAEIVRHLVTESKGDESKNVLLMIKSGQRLEVSAVEIAEGIARLDAFGFTVEEIAAKVGKTVQYVYYMKKVNSLPFETKTLLRNKKITLTKALASVSNRPKKYVPPKKAVKEILDLVAESEPEINGDSVRVSIPIELYKQLFDPSISID